mmetsp:Transcript_81314/g.161699  ORF Transcript_81314/g.161699 Transcript_81314/m.161699 type:complete len:358 (+) Transcript_81314:2274-3347(+)
MPRSSSRPCRSSQARRMTRPPSRPIPPSCLTHPLPLRSPTRPLPLRSRSGMWRRKPPRLRRRLQPSRSRARRVERSRGARPSSSGRARSGWSSTRQAAIVASLSSAPAVNSRPTYRRNEPRAGLHEARKSCPSLWPCRPPVPCRVRVEGRHSRRRLPRTRRASWSVSTRSTTRARDRSVATSSGEWWVSSAAGTRPPMSRRASASSTRTPAALYLTWSCTGRSPACPQQRRRRTTRRRRTRRPCRVVAALALSATARPVQATARPVQATARVVQATGPRTPSRPTSPVLPRRPFRSIGRRTPSPARSLLQQSRPPPRSHRCRPQRVSTLLPHLPPIPPLLGMTWTTSRSSRKARTAR